MKTRYMGLDLGTKTLGIAISDRTNTIITPYKVIRFKSEEYETAFQELKEIIAKEGITEIAIGLPKNMDGSEGFAAQRTYNFCELLKTLNIKLSLVDERLSSVEAQKILLANGKHAKDIKDKFDMHAAAIILETYIRSKNAG